MKRAVPVILLILMVTVLAGCSSWHIAKAYQKAYFNVLLCARVVIAYDTGTGIGIAWNQYTYPVMFQTVSNDGIIMSVRIDARKTIHLQRLYPGTRVSVFKVTGKKLCETKLVGAMEEKEDAN